MSRVVLKCGTTYELPTSIFDLTLGEMPLRARMDGSPIFLHLYPHYEEAVLAVCEKFGKKLKVKTKFKRGSAHGN